MPIDKSAEAAVRVRGLERKRLEVELLSRTLQIAQAEHRLLELENEQCVVTKSLEDYRRLHGEITEQLQALTLGQEE